MRYAKEHKLGTRQRIVETASRRFREEGIDAVGVASLMSSAGLTHGGFYAHFASKEDLVGAACVDAFTQTIDRLRQIAAAAAPGAQTTALAETYLSPAHLEQPGSGCMAAAVGSEIPHHSPEARTQFTEQLQALIGLVEDTLRADGASPDYATGIVGSMVGTLTMARAVTDPTLAQTMLQAGLRQVGLVVGGLD